MELKARQLKQQQIEAQQRKAQQLKEKLLTAEMDHEALKRRVQSEKLQERIIQHDMKEFMTPRTSYRLHPQRRQQLLGRATEQLVGEYVKVCTPWGCKINYKPETDSDMQWYHGHNATSSWPGKGHVELVTGNHLLYPLGPTMRENLTRMQVPLHDIVPKHSKLGDNWVTFGHGDTFVKVENSGLSSSAGLPPWKRPPLYNFNNFNNTYKPLTLTGGPLDYDPSSLPAGPRAAHRCPANPDGTAAKDCLTGGDGVDGVFESSPLSPSYFDPNRALMEQHGVKVDSWPWVSDFGRHAWDSAAKDHGKPPRAAAFDYDAAERPLWAFDNHALRSQPAYADPEGPANKELMLGSGWKQGAGLPDMDDAWVRNDTYALQFEPVHLETVEDDHFKDWLHNSTHNVRLLYGDSDLFNGMRRRPDGTAEPDPWSLGDMPLPVEEYGDAAGLDPLGNARTGDPWHDAQAGWAGQNMVAAGAVHLAHAPPAAARSKAVGPSAGRLKLERAGVNV